MADIELPAAPQHERPGAMLARLRGAIRPRVSQKAFGDTIGYSRSAVAGAETGSFVPARAFWISADQAIGAGGALLAAYDQAESAAAATSNATTVDVVLHEAAAAAKHHAALLAMAAVPDDFLTMMEAETVHAALRYATTAPPVLLRELEAARMLAVTALDRTRRPAEVARIMRVLARVCGLAATTAFDLGRARAAADYAHAAYQYAELAGDADLQGWARSAQATVAFWSGSPESGLVWAADGLRVARGHGAARLHAIAARAHALLGDTDAARASVDDAHTHVDQDVPGMVGELVFSPTRLALCAAAVHVTLGDGAAAAQFAQDAINFDESSPASTRRFAVASAARMELAAARLLTGDPESVGTIIEPALAIAPERRTMRLARRFTGLDRRLASDASSDTLVVRELRERIALFRSESLPALTAGPD